MRGNKRFFIATLLPRIATVKKKLRPDVAFDTSRRNNRYVPTYSQIRRDAVSRTSWLPSGKAFPTLSESLLDFK